MEEYDTIRTLAAGALSQTFLIKHKRTEEIFVLKKHNLVSDEAKEKAIGEIFLMTRTRHENIVRLVTHIPLKEGQIGIIVEYCEGGNLLQQIDEMKKSSQHFPEETVFRWTKQLAAALEHIHSRLMIHRDLRPDNIFLTKDGNIKIGDFGISVLVAERSAHIRGFGGMMLYAAPEVFDDEEYTYRCDLWTLGVILYEIVNLRKPYNDVSEIFTRPDVEFRKNVDFKLEGVIRDLLQPDPKKRPRGADVLAKLSEKNTANPVDIAIILDCTGSMDQYIEKARDNICNIAEQITKEGYCNPRFALIEFRDHPPEDTTFVTRSHDFTDDIEGIKKLLDKCEAYGGGDTPEAVADAVFEATMLSWNDSATKLVLLITDGPPHGIGCLLDAFPSGCPCGHDLLRLCESLGKRGVKLHVIGGEPKISQYVDVYAGMALKTSGRYLPLNDPAELAALVAAAALEAVSVKHFEETIGIFVSKVIDSGKSPNEREVASQVYQDITSRGAVTKSLRAGLMSPTVTSEGKEFAKCRHMGEMKTRYATYRRKMLKSPPPKEGSTKHSNDYKVVDTPPSKEEVQRISEKLLRERST